VVVTAFRHELGATATYTRRTVLWVGGVGSGDGAMVLTVYAARKMPVNKCYWVEVVDDRVLVWETAGGVKTKAYTVTGGRCSCDGMRKMGAADCKHRRAVLKLIEMGHLVRPWPAVRTHSHSGG
jgi:hypothetical protein